MQSDYHNLPLINGTPQKNGKPDFFIFPQRFCFGNIHALDTLLYRFFRISMMSMVLGMAPMYGPKNGMTLVTPTITLMSAT